MARSISIFIAVLAVIWLFLEFWESPPEAFFSQKTTVTTTSKATTYMRNTETRQFNLLGDMEYQLNTNETEQFNRGKRVDMKQPKLVSYQQGQSPWTLTANHGRILKSGDEVVLTGNVYGWQPVTEGGIRELKTSKLRLFPEKKLADTDKPVTLQAPGSTVNGVGMQADLNKQQYKLTSRVKSKYDAPKNAQ